MLHSDPSPTVSPASPAVARFIAQAVAACLDIRAVWRIDLCPDDSAPAATRVQLLAFADAATLARLRKLADLHCAGIELLIVVDGDVFEAACGPGRLSGSLVRWAWRQVSPREAYYDESRWSERAGDAGRVVRVRRKARLVWSTMAPSPC